jgi:multidrug efflux pump subunit AcrA (membrane-fusion protein)
MEHEEKEIILRSEEVNEILSKPPAWLVRWGILVIFILICCFLGLTWLIEYPDTLIAKASISSVNPPVTVLARSAGKLQKLYRTNNALLKKDDVIAVLENTSDATDMLLLEKQLTIFKESIKLAPDSVVNVDYFSDGLELGDLTPRYYEFLKSLKDYQLYLVTNPQQKQIALLNKELSEYESLRNKLNKQNSLQAQELNLVKSDFERSKKLYESKTISAKEFDDKKIQYLNAQRNIENQNISLSNNNITINNISKTKLQLQLQQFEDAKNYNNSLNLQLKTLENSIENWKKQYLLQTPIQGQLSYINLWKENQDVKVDDALFIIVPDIKSEYIAKLQLPVANSGKAKIGQQVNLELDNYNSAEYGILKGKLTNISAIAINGNYTVDVTLDNGLTTSYKQKLNDKSQMSATAYIVTERKKLIDRIFKKFKELTKKN